MAGNSGRCGPSVGRRLWSMAPGWLGGGSVIDGKVLRRARVLGAMLNTLDAQGFLTPEQWQKCEQALQGGKAQGSELRSKSVRLRKGVKDAQCSD